MRATKRSTISSSRSAPWGPEHATTCRGRSRQFRVQISAFRFSSDFGFQISRLRVRSIVVRDLTEPTRARPMARLVDANSDAARFGNQIAVRGVAEIPVDRVRLVVRGVDRDRTNGPIPRVRVRPDGAAGQLDELGPGWSG